MEMELSMDVSMVSSAKVMKQMNHALYKAMVKMKEIAMRKVPVDMGGLKASIKLKPNDRFANEYILRASAGYAVYLEYGCYSEDTEILTKSGWKKYNEATENDKVLVFDQDIRELYYEKPQKLIIKEFDGYMINFKNQKCDMLVTPNHRVLKYSRNSKQDYVIKKIIEAKTKWDTTVFRIPRAGVWKGKIKDGVIIKKGMEKEKIKIDMKNFLRFAGLYVADGCLNMQKYAKRVEIYQKNHIKEVKQILNDLGLHFFSDKNKVGCVRFMISISDLVEKMKEFGVGVYNKKIPDWVKELDVDYLQAFLDGYLIGDGNENRKFFTTSKRLKDDLMEISIKLNKGCMVSIREESHSKINNRIIKSTKENYIGYIGRNYVEFHKGRCGTIEKKKYKGKVWDYYVKNKCVVTRRKGKIIISGNTSPHWVPIAPLLGWAKRHGGDEGFAYAIQQKIAKVGTNAQPFFRPAYYEVKDKWLPFYVNQVLGESDV